MSLVERFKPLTIDKVVIDKENLIKDCLKAMIKKPQDAPKVIVIAGPYGTGRKSLARNFIKSKYCQNLEKYSNCGTCEICSNILNDKSVYQEVDYSYLEDEFNFTTKNIIITNFEKCSRKTQQKLYEWFNEQVHKPTIILITETTDNLIDNIYTLSFILRTSLLTLELIVNNLYEIKEKLNLDISKQQLITVARRSRGHLSEAHKMLENYSTLDEETFKYSIQSAREIYLAFLISCYRDNKEDVDKYISMLKNFPLAYLKIDYEALIVEIMKYATKIIKWKPDDETKDELLIMLFSFVKNKALDLYYVLNDKIIYNSFDSDDKFQAAMYVIYLKLNNRIR